MIRALRSIRSSGVKTNIPLCVEVLDSTQFRSGKYSTRLLDRDLRMENLRAPDETDLARAAAAAAILEDMRMRPLIQNVLAVSTSNNTGGWKRRRFDSFRE